MKSGHILQALHDSEINWRIECFFDGCWTASLGDELNGFIWENSGLANFGECVVWLTDNAVRSYPNSVFAKRIKTEAAFRKGAEE